MSVKPYKSISIGSDRLLSLAEPKNRFFRPFSAVFGPIFLLFLKIILSQIV